MRVDVQTEYCWIFRQSVMLSLYHYESLDVCFNILDQTNESCFEFILRVLSGRKLISGLTRGRSCLTCVSAFTCLSNMAITLRSVGITVLSSLVQFYCVNPTTHTKTKRQNIHLLHESICLLHHGRQYESSGQPDLEVRLMGKTSASTPPSQTEYWPSTASPTCLIRFAFN